MTPRQEMAIRAACAALADALIDAISTSQVHPAPPRLLSVAEVARALGISRTTVYDEMALGRLASVKVGRRRLVPADTVEGFIEAASSR